MSVPPFVWNAPDDFAGKSSAIRRPREIASFSYDEKRQFRNGDSSLRYYYTPELGVNLSEGFNDFISHDDSIPDHLDGLLKGITEHEKKTSERIHADILTWRGLVTKLMILPFESRDAFRLNAIKFQGTIYIEEDHEFKLAQKSGQRGWGGPISQDEMSFWGYKFETLSTLPAPWDECSRETIESRRDEIVNQEPQYCSVVKTGIGKTRLIIGGEVDAVWDKKPEDPTEPINYVELKTSKIIQSDRDAINFERKMMRFWAQSFLLGVPKIIVGLRTNNGILSDIQEMETHKLPTIAKKSGRRLWDGNVCINFASAILEWLTASIPESDGSQVWSIRHDENRREVVIVPSTAANFLESGFLKWRIEGV